MKCLLMVKRKKNKQEKKNIIFLKNKMPSKKKNDPIIPTTPRYNSRGDPEKKGRIKRNPKKTMIHHKKNRQQPDLDTD